MAVIVTLWQQCIIIISSSSSSSSSSNNPLTRNVHSSYIQGLVFSKYCFNSLRPSGDGEGASDGDDV